MIHDWQRTIQLNRIEGNLVNLDQFGEREDQRTSFKKRQLEKSMPKFFAKKKLVSQLNQKI